MFMNVATGTGTLVHELNPRADRPRLPHGAKLVQRGARESLRALLPAYYREFRDHAGQDPNGLKSLVKLIAPQRLDEFEQQWKAWVLQLRFR